MPDASAKSNFGERHGASRRWIEAGTALAAGGLKRHGDSRLCIQPPVAVLESGWGKPCGRHRRPNSMKRSPTPDEVYPMLDCMFRSSLRASIGLSCSHGGGGTGVIVGQRVAVRIDWSGASSLAVAPPPVTLPCWQ